MITIRFDARQALRNLDAAAKKQIPFAVAQTVNALAFQVMDAENAAMKQVFEKPGRWTTTAVQVEQKARKDAAIAIVSTRPGREYLTPYETGGVHVLPPTKSRSGGTLFNPKAVKLKGDGRRNGGTIAELLARPDVFKGEIHGVRGIWQRLPRTRAGRRGLPNGVARQQVRLLIRFGDALPVKQHLDFHKRAAAVVTRQVAALFNQSFAYALKTAR